jgi:hypothetical protein
MILNRKALTSIIVGTCIVGFAPATHATIMGLSYQDTASGTLNNQSVVTAFPATGSAFYGDSFNAPTTPISGSPSPGYGFYDDFYFSVPTSVKADSITATLNLGNLLAISGLQVRLYNLAGNPPPVLGAPLHGTIVSSWSTSVSAGPGLSGDVEVLNTTLSQTGTYVLEVRGNVSGSAGGSYGGALNVSPVPVPAALPSMLSALGLLGTLARRRRVTAPRSVAA